MQVPVPVGMSGPYGVSVSGSGQEWGFVSFLTALTETAAGAAGAAAASIAAAQEADQQSSTAQLRETGEGLNLSLPSPGLVEFYRSYQRCVEASALPTWWLKVGLGKQGLTVLRSHMTRLKQRIR